MTNIDKIRKMDEYKLATLLVRETFQEDIDYNLAILLMTDWNLRLYMKQFINYQMVQSVMVMKRLLKNALDGSRRT